VVAVVGEEPPKKQGATLLGSEFDIAGYLRGQVPQLLPLIEALII
jgi:hypothetical protein